MDFIYNTHLEDNDPIRITYNTRVKPGVIVDTNKYLHNSVTRGNQPNPPTADVGYWVTQREGVKLVRHYDPASHSVEWTVSVNGNHYMLEALSVKDDSTTNAGNYIPLNELASGNMLDIASYNEQGQKVKDLVMGTDYEVAPAISNGYAGSFTIDFTKYITMSGGATADSFEITMRTNHSSLADEAPFNNTALVTFTPQGGVPHTSTGTATFTPPADVRQNGGKPSGTYDPVNKEITWHYYINLNATGLQNAYVDDVIEEGQTYVPGSAQIYNYTIDPVDAHPVRNADPITNLDNFAIVEPASMTSPPQPLRVRFPDAVGDDSGNALYWVEYKTSVDKTFIKASYSNTATFYNANHETVSWTGVTTVSHGGRLVEKTGRQGTDGFLNWQVLINGSQSTLKPGAILTDRPSEGQFIDVNSIKIYGTTLDQHGEPQLDNTKQVPNGDYTVDYDQTTTPHTLTVTFSNAMDRAYIMQYRASIYVSAQNPPSKVSNNATLRGDIESTETDTDNPSIAIDVNRGGGTILGTLAGITFKKIADDGTPLAGATFQLYDGDGNPVGGPMVSGADGTFRYENIVTNKYTIRETAAPDGYSISPLLWAGVSVAVNADTSSEEYIVTFANTPSQVYLNKVDEENYVLAGAQFMLEETQGGNWVRVRSDEAIQSDDIGLIVINGLGEGSYRLTETKAPDGYLINTTPVPFTIVREADGKIPVENLGGFTNYKATAQFTKMGENQQVLAGVEFKLTERNTGAYIGNYTSDGNGIVRMENLSPGCYRVEETHPQEGYVLGALPIEFSVQAQAEGKPELIDLGVYHNSKYAGSIQLLKTDADSGAVLGGAWFELLDENGAVVRRNISTDNEGKVFVGGLLPGRYQLAETQAPDGYILDAIPVEAEIGYNEGGNSEPVAVVKTNKHRDQPPAPSPSPSPSPSGPPPSPSVTPPSTSISPEPPSATVAQSAKTV
jgi:uncharacterized surface anchored protein